MVDFNLKDRYNFNDLVDIMRLLRAPGGCPWDREQTHKSIRKNLIEETYEVIEAIDKENPDMLKEELGDLLMQIVFHSLMEEESDSFNMNDVSDDICKKLIIRHPHIFGDITVNNTDDVLTNWDAIKMQTKGQKNAGESMISVPRELPALMRAEKIQKKAAKVGFDWDDVSGAIDKLYEEIGELKEAIKDSSNIKEEFGDFLFSAVNVSRFINVDPEEALTFASDKFTERFIKVEKLAEDKNINMKESSLDVLDSLWDEAKRN